MRIAVFGVGGAGGYFGGRLAQAGADVVFVARGETLRALRSDGLAIESPKGDARLSGLRVAASAEEAGPADAVILGVKSWQVPEAAAACRPMMREESFVVPIQNGVDAPGQIADALGARHVVGGLARIIAFQTAPARIRHVGAEPYIGFGELAGGGSARTESLRDALSRAGVAAEVLADIRRAMWEKFLLVVPLGGVGAVARVPIGALLRSPHARSLLEEAMAEIVAVARARGIPLTAAAAERSMAFLEKLPPEGTTSLQRDHAEGRPSELEAWTGAVVRLAREAGVAAPVHGVLYRALKPGEDAARSPAGAPAGIG